MTYKPDEPFVYLCQDCGKRVMLWGEWRPPVLQCSTCAWITGHVPPEEQPEMRAKLGVPLALDCSS